MNRFFLLASAVLALFLSACGTPPKAPPPPGDTQLNLNLASGNYLCEEGVRLRVERQVRDSVTYRVHIGWNGGHYWLDRDPSYSGLPRFEDRSSGLVWIDLPWKSVLLDGRTNKPLANECRSA